MTNWVQLGAIVGTGGVAVLWLTVRELTKRIDRLERSLNAVFEYAKEIDPRHDEERQLIENFNIDGGLMYGLHHLNYVKAKRARGERTLNDPLFPVGDR